jgi:hypothetical protein
LRRRARGARSEAIDDAARFAGQAKITRAQIERTESRAVFELAPSLRPFVERYKMFVFNFVAAEPNADMFAAKAYLFRLDNWLLHELPDDKSELMREAPDFLSEALCHEPPRRFSGDMVYSETIPNASLTLDFVLCDYVRFAALNEMLELPLTDAMIRGIRELHRLDN